MTRKFLFADEAGDFAFKRGANIPEYFILGTVAVESCAIGAELLALRRELAWRDQPLGDYFHASEDKQAIRDAVFDLIRGHDFQIHATIMKKAKAMPHVRADKATFYKYGWLYHFKNSSLYYLGRDDELHITTASIGTKRGQGIFTSAVNDVVQQIIGRRQWATSFWPANTDPCLQVADYCVWAIQRKWERNDSRSYDLIREKIVYEYDLWGQETTYYY